jgi:hypothetical protein
VTRSSRRGRGCSGGCWGAVDSVDRSREDGASCEMRTASDDGPAGIDGVLTIVPSSPCLQPVEPILLRPDQIDALAVSQVEKVASGLLR